MAKPKESYEDFSEQIRTILPELKQQYGVKDLWLFGSYVRAEQHDVSDLDVLVSFENPTLSLIEFIQLEQKLSDLLGVRVDLVEKETLKPGIGQRVLQEAQPV
ncbi:MAG: nucleotidyltransferase family protein [Ardenticatenaceae bacterium]|nr:nucleotidyltransferase family protein [Ardenticatenaceae bacterium]